MKTDIFILLAAVAVSVGVTLLLSQYFGGNGGQSAPRAIPSDNPSNSGGWSPGFVSTLVSNGRRGGSTPSVLFN